MFGGDAGLETSVESFEASQHLNGNAAIEWQLHDFFERNHVFGNAPSVCPINSEEIVILGGFRNENGISMFNTRTNRISFKHEMGV